MYIILCIYNIDEVLGKIYFAGTRMEKKTKKDHENVKPDGKDTQKYKLIKESFFDSDIRKDDTQETKLDNEETTDAGSTTIVRSAIKFNKKKISKSKTGDFMLKKSTPLPEYLVPHLKKAFVLNVDEGIHIYDENYRLIGSILGMKKEETEDSKTVEFFKNDLLPNKLRSNCIEAGNGYQTKIGSNLYIMNSKFKVTDKVNLTYTDIENFKEIPSKGKTNIPLRGPETDEIKPEETVKIKKEKEKVSKLSAKEIVDVFIGKFKYGLKINNIKADYFVKEKLGDKNLQSLNCLYNGDLSQLNENTRNFEPREKISSLNGGLSLLKAGLIHELYVNSTLEGRGGKEGNNMNKFLTYIITLKKDGSVKEINNIISTAEQKKLISFLSESQSRFPDKSDVIRNVYHKISSDHKRMELEKEMKDIGYEKFKAFIIRKLYEYTNRLERGNGITMICLTRDIIDFGIKK